MPITKSVVEINRVLDKYSDNCARLSWACDRIAWLSRFHKVPKELANALAIKAIAIMDGVWCGDETEENIIKKYIQEGKK